MKIEKQYANILEKSLAFAQKGEPAVFVGMYDCGKNYTFGLLSEKVSRTPELPFILLLSNVGTTENEWLESIRTELSVSGYITGNDEIAWEEGEIILRQIIEKQKLCLVVNLGYQVRLPDRIIKLWDKLRNLYGNKFSYQLFANAHVIFDRYPAQAVYDKIVKRNICAIKPLSGEDLDLTLSMYETRFGVQLDSKIRARVLEFSGGNPGILKAVYLQALDNPSRFSEVNIFDGRLHFRLQRIIGELPKEYLKALLSREYRDENSSLFLHQYGYLTPQNDIFSPIIGNYLDFLEQGISPIQLQEDILINFTLTERKVYQLLQSQKSFIVSRDQIAQEIWGTNWENKYSDWALDQIMSQLRKKLTKEQGKMGTIVTKKGEGYIFKGK